MLQGWQLALFNEKSQIYYMMLVFSINFSIDDI